MAQSFLPKGSRLWHGLMSAGRCDQDADVKSVATTVLESDTETDRMDPKIGPTAPPCTRVLRISETALGFMMTATDKIQLHELGYWTLHLDGRPQAVRILRMSVATSDDLRLRRLRRHHCTKIPCPRVLVRCCRYNMWRGLAQVLYRPRRFQLAKFKSLPS